MVNDAPLLWHVSARGRSEGARIDGGYGQVESEKFIRVRW